jgi:hypothetical protein
MGEIICEDGILLLSHGKILCICGLSDSYSAQMASKYMKLYTLYPERQILQRINRKYNKTGNYT